MAPTLEPTSPNHSPKKIPSNIILLSVVSFFNDISSEMIIPILPMFLRSLGSTAEIIGLVGGFRDGISNILKVFCGYWSDKTGKRKIFVYSGYFISTIFKLLLAVSRFWQSAFVFSSLERLGKGVRTAARDAIIADSMTTRKGMGFGLHRSLDTMGAILGAVGAFVLLWFFKLNFSHIILIAGVISFASLVPLRFVKEKKSLPQDITLKIGIKILPVNLRLFILISSVFALGNFSYMFFILRAQQFFKGGLSTAAPILLYVLFNLVYSALAVPLGMASDRLGRGKVIIFGYICFSATSLGFVLFNSLPAFIILFALYGVMYAAIEGNQRAYVSDLAKVHLRATALGTFHTVTGLMALPASMVAGILWERVGPSATFIYGGTLALMSVVLFIVFRSYFSPSALPGARR